MSQNYKIYQRSDGRYECRIPIGRSPSGSVIYHSLYSKDEKNLKKKIDKEFSIDYRHQTVSQVRFNTLFDKWLLSKMNTVRESTLSVYRTHLDRYIRPVFGSRYIVSMTSEKLNTLCDKHIVRCKGKRGHNLSTSSRIDILRVLNSALRYGMNHGYIPYHLQADYPKADPVPMNVLREEELAALEQTLKEDYYRREALGIFLCLYTGLRVGELCGLKWEDIDTKNKMIYVRRTVQRIYVEDQVLIKKTKVMIGDPKSNSSRRDIPIPDHLLEVLADLKPEKEDTYFLSDSYKCYEPRRMQTAYHRYLDRAGVERRGFHSTRHTFATRWVELGVDIKTLSEILGHTGIQVTLDKYVHISNKVKRENINKLQPLLGFDYSESDWKPSVAGSNLKLVGALSPKSH